MIDVIGSMLVQMKVYAVLAPSRIAEQGSAVYHFRRRVIVLYWQVAGDELFTCVLSTVIVQVHVSPLHFLCVSLIVQYGLVTAAGRAQVVAAVRRKN